MHDARKSDDTRQPGPERPTTDQLVEIRAIVRIELLDSVVHCLEGAGVPRLAVDRVHAIGSGVDPDAVRISFDEGPSTPRWDECGSSVAASGAGCTWS